MKQPPAAGAKPACVLILTPSKSRADRDEIDPPVFWIGFGPGHGEQCVDGGGHSAGLSADQK